jgi:hypothetical protein
MVRIFSKSRRYIDELKSSMNIKNKIDSHKIESLYEGRARLIKSRDGLNFFRAIFYIALYASILSGFTTIFNLLPLLSEVLDFILTYLGIIGTTFSIIMIVVLGHSIQNYDRDIATIESHILSMHVKHDKSSIEDFDLLMKKIK